MTDDRDLMAVLPDPPPPRPDRRTMAIDAALRRFDGHGEEQRKAPAGISFRTVFARPQVAALATVALVALLSLPLWLSDGDRFVEAGRERPAAETGSAETPTPSLSREIQPPSLAASGAPGTDDRATATAPAMERETELSDAAGVAEKASPPAASAEVQLNRLPAFAPTTDARPAAEGQFALAPPPPPAPAAMADRADDDSRTVVVTGSRVVRQESAALANRVRTAEAAAEQAGDWNACTIKDPRQDLRDCDELGDLAAPGATGRANAHLADGLTLAWQGDLDRAIDAFDRAIALAPDLSLAYLNRGLARWQEGDIDRALEDFDEAIASDPDAARGYYHRGRLYRARGANARASGDARRAMRLDPSFESVIP